MIEKAFRISFILLSAWFLQLLIKVFLKRLRKIIKKAPLETAAQRNQKVGLEAYQKIKLDSETNRQLKKNNLVLDSILPKDQDVVLSSVANCSTGGVAQALSLHSLHPTIIKSAVKTARVIGLNFVGVDFILKNPKRPFEEENGFILETNSSPGLIPHHYPFIGQPQKIAPMILKTLLT